MREHVAFLPQLADREQILSNFKKLQRCVRDCLSAPARSAVTLNCFWQFTAGSAEDVELGAASVSPWVWHWALESL
jgi:hypothetical protein